MHFIDTEKTRCFLNLMIQMHSAPSVFYRKAGCTKEFLATVSYNLLKMKTSPLLDLGNEFWGKREWERGEKKEKKKREMEAKQTKKKFIWNWSNPIFSLCIRNLFYFGDEFIFKDMPILLRGIPDLTAVQSALQCTPCSPTCFLQNTTNFPELRLCQYHCALYLSLISSKDNAQPVIFPGKSGKVQNWVWMS